jgi:hypothetical protein
MVEIVGLTAVMESDTAYMIPRRDATLLDIIVESNSVNGKRIKRLRASWTNELYKVKA